MYKRQVTDITEEGGGLYNLQSGYSAPTASIALDLGSQLVIVASGTIGAGGIATFASTDANTAGYNLPRLLRFDPDLTEGEFFAAGYITDATLTSGQFNFDELVDLVLTDASQTPTTTLINAATQVRRLT